MKDHSCQHLPALRNQTTMERWLVTKRCGSLLIALFFGLSLAYGLIWAAGSRAKPAAAASPALTDIEESVMVLTDLMVETKVSSQTVRPGGWLTYTIQYTNTTGQAVTGVMISATLSAGQSFGGSFTSSPVIPSGQFTYTGAAATGYQMKWQEINLAAHSAGTIWVQTQVITSSEPALQKSIMLVGLAAEIASAAQPGLTNNSDDAVTMVVGPILELDKSASPTSVMPGFYLTYTLSLQNYNRLDSIAATNLVISDSLPEYSTFVGASDGGYLDQATNHVTWQIPGPLEPGNTRVVRFTVRVSPNANPLNIIRNMRSEYRVRSSEIRLAAVIGKRDINTFIDSLLKKTAKAKRMLLNTPNVYPTEEVTYTLSVYNPLTMTLTGVVVTDTLPGTPMPFEYLRPASGSPAPDAILENGRKLVWLMNLDPWASATRSFVVRVPAQTKINDNTNTTIYYNTLQAFHPQANFKLANNLAPVWVNAPVVLSKQVSPTHGMVGETVFYTITLNNQGPFLVNNIVLTDTMEGGFRYLYMTQGPLPLPGYRNNPVVWTGLQVSPGATFKLSFAARIDGEWLHTYYNNLAASSPVVYIPRRTHLTGVKVDPPLGIDKSVSPPETFINTYVNYSIDVTNMSTTTWRLASLSDLLPTGFFQASTGTNPAVINPDPDVDIPPGGTWSGGFDAWVSPQVGCAGLPKTLKNTAGNIHVFLTSPLVLEAVNAVDLAPLKINPNVLVDLVPYRQSVVRGGTFTYTLKLSNVSPVSASNSTISLALPAGITYLSTVSGTPPAVNQNTLTWTGLSIPANQSVSIVMNMAVNTSTSYGTKTPTLTASAVNVCFGKLGSGGQTYGDGKVTVVDALVKLTKNTLSQQVAPLSLVDFELKIENRDGYPLTVQVITDTMPDGFTYFGMVSGPPPVQQGSRLIWNGTNLSGKQTLTWKLRLQSPALYGSYINQLSAYSPETPITDAIGVAPVNVLPLFKLLKTAGSPVVSPGSTVPYTITLVNLSQTIYSQVRVTDTLPAGFRFYQMRSGYPAPVTLGPNFSQPVWNNLSVGANCGPNGCTTRLVFDVLVSNLAAPGTYWNQVIGSSLSGSIPGPILTAPVEVFDSNPPAARLFLPLVARNP